MADPTRLTEIGLSPIPGKTYFSIDREWREEFIYFLMVDRFSDGVDRPVTSGTGRSAGVDTPDGNVPLRDVLTGAHGPQTLFNRLKAQRDRALNRGEIGRYLVTFVDNHDSFWLPGGRFPAIANDNQVIATAGFLLCALGTPCLYYGDEQGLTGAGGDNEMRQALFDTTGDRSLLNPQCRIYREIARLAAVMRAQQALRFGRMYYRQISGDGEATVQQAADGTHFVRLDLAPHQFVVLR
jgi:glycosidase